jgi:integrase
MASILPHGDKWRAFIDKAGVKKTKVFTVKARAVAWANQMEVDIENGKNGLVADKTFGQLIERYRDEITILKKGERAERLKLDKLLREDPICQVKLKDLNETHFAAWRDRRLKFIQGSSVNREWCTLNHALSIARKEWKWIDTAPMKNVRHPAGNPHRDRIATDDEIEKILITLGTNLFQIGGRVGKVVEFALETGMRAGEIATLEKPHLRLDQKMLKACEGRVKKSQASKRDVPLSKKAIEIIEVMLEASPSDSPSVFNVVESQIDSMFRKAKKSSGVSGLTFHDLRHTAITRLANKLHVLDLARMIGHKDLKKLQIYYNPSATDLANLLD